MPATTGTGFRAVVLVTCMYVDRHAKLCMHICMRMRNSCVLEMPYIHLARLCVFAGSVACDAWIHINGLELLLACDRSAVCRGHTSVPMAGGSTASSRRHTAPQPTNGGLRRDASQGATGARGAGKPRAERPSSEATALSRGLSLKFEGEASERSVPAGTSCLAGAQGPDRAPQVNNQLVRKRLCTPAEAVTQTASG